MFRTTIKNIRGIRFQSTSVNIGEKFKSKQELNQYLSTPSWSINELLTPSKQSKRADSIDSKTVERLLELSGLEANPEKYDELISILKSQVVFIDQLHSIPDSDIEYTTTQSSLSKLTLQDIEQNIENQKPDVSKGEVPESWDPLSLAKESLNGFYIVKEGLIKNK